MGTARRLGRLLLLATLLAALAGPASARADAAGALAPHGGPGYHDTTAQTTDPAPTADERRCCGIHCPTPALAACPHLGWWLPEENRARSAADRLPSAPTLHTRPTPD